MNSRKFSTFVSSANLATSFSASSSTHSGLVNVRKVNSRIKPLTTKEVEKAVYAYIQAIRALGRTNVNTAEIANALKLKSSDVESAAQKLAAKGVKILA